MEQIPFAYYKEIISNYREIKDELDMYSIEEYVCYLDGDVIIIGQLNKSNYCWCSITNIEDEVINEQIFNHLLTNKFSASVKFFTSISDALNELMITAEKIEYYY